jgi:hypothetical protein
MDLPGGAPEAVEPTLAPRLRNFLPRLLSPPMPPQHGGQSATPQLFEIGWNACGEARRTPAGGWHRDRGGGGGGGGNDVYVYPEAVHAAMYFRDMDGVAAGSGSTLYLRGSHLCATTEEDFQPPRDDDDAGPRVARFQPRAQDVVLFDQRGWHMRGDFTPRHAADRRVLAVYGWHQTQMWADAGHSFDGILYEPSPMPQALARRWVEASAAGDGTTATYLGGRWTPASVYRMIEELKKEAPELVQQMLDRDAAAAAAAGGTGGALSPTDLAAPPRLPSCRL